MAEGALTEEAVLSGLADIRLPPEAAGGMAGEVLAALALGLGLAALLALMLRPLTRRRARPLTAPRLGDRLAEAEALSGEARALALLRLLKETDPEAYAREAAGRYAPGGLPAPEHLAREIRRHA